MRTEKNESTFDKPSKYQLSMQTRFQKHYQENKQKKLDELYNVLNATYSDGNTRFQKIYEYVMENHTFVTQEDKLWHALNQKAAEFVNSPNSTQKTKVLLIKWLEFYARK